MRPTQKANYSVVLDQLVPCIYETVEEADTARLFKLEYINELYMSRMEQLGIVLSLHNPTQESVC